MDRLRSLSNIQYLALAGCLALAGLAGLADAAPPRCRPLPVVRILLAGDSTQFALDGATHQRAPDSPHLILQQLLDWRFGAGVTVVENIAVSGATSAQLEPAALRGADVSVVNFGINDTAFLTIEQYKANLRALRPTILETPSPTHRKLQANPEPIAYAQAMREVAAETGTPLADVTPFVLKQPDWLARIPDRIHPDQVLYWRIVVGVLAPVVGEQVARLRCMAPAGRPAPVGLPPR